MRLRKALLPAYLALLASCESDSTVPTQVVNGLSNVPEPKVVASQTELLDEPDARQLTPIDPAAFEQPIDAWDAANVDTAQTLTYLSRTEQEVILEMNKLRTNPPRYAKLHLEPLRKYYDGLLFRLPDELPLRTDEGVAALDECIAVLRATEPVQPLHPKKGLCHAASDHTKDQGASGATGHIGSDDSSPSGRASRYGHWSGARAENISYGRSTGRTIVIQWLVDDGVRSRGHRENLLNGQFACAGVAVGPHRQYDNMCVATFAGGYEDSPD